MLTKLEEIYNSLQDVTRINSKYEWLSVKYRLGFKVVTRDDPVLALFDSALYSFVVRSSYCVVIPEYTFGSISGLLFRSFPNKDFRFITKYKGMPFGLDDKEYSRPWIVTESALDALYLKMFYPHVVATMGVSVSSNAMEFLYGTTPKLIFALDNDEHGLKKFYSLRKKYPDIHKWIPPTGCKDFGDCIESGYKSDYITYEYYCEYVKGFMKLL